MLPLFSFTCVFNFKEFHSLFLSLYAFRLYLFLVCPNLGLSRLVNILPAFLPIFLSLHEMGFLLLVDHLLYLRLQHFINWLCFMFLWPKKFVLVSKLDTETVWFPGNQFPGKYLICRHICVSGSWGYERSQGNKRGAFPHPTPPIPGN